MNLGSTVSRLAARFGNSRDKIAYARRLGVTIGNNCSIIGKTIWGTEPYLISLGNDVRIAHNVEFITHDGGMHVLRNLYDDVQHAGLFGRIVIGDNVFLGMNCTILPGVIIGSNVVIGAGSIVTHDIPSNCVACGVPAIPIQSIHEYYLKNRDRALISQWTTPMEKQTYIIAHTDK